MAAALCSPGGGAGGRLRSERRVRWVLSSRAAGARNGRVVMCPRAGWVCHWPYPDMRASAWRHGLRHGKHRIAVHPLNQGAERLKRSFSEDTAQIWDIAGLVGA
jgi:hypothetical protein